MTQQDETPEALRARLQQAASAGRAPAWLRQALGLLAASPALLPPIEDDRSALPEFIYRH